MPYGLENKTAIITGAGGAIGRAVALYLAEKGVKIVANDLGATNSGDGKDSGPAQQTVKMIEDLGGKAVTSTENVADWTQAQQVVQRALDSFGGLDIVINNAGNIRYAAFQDSDPADVRALIDVHLFGTYNISRAATPHLIAQKSGVFVNMTSSTALIGMRGNAGYTAAKMGAVGLSRSIALDLAPFNIRCNCLAPAATSRMSPKRATPELEAHYASRARADQIAPVAAFLASDAAKSINGQIIGARGNELYLYNQSRPICMLHRSDGWDLDKIAAQLLPAWHSWLTPLEETHEVFAWPPQ